MPHCVPSGAIFTRGHGHRAVQADLEQRPRPDDGTGSGVCSRRKHRVSDKRECHCEPEGRSNLPGGRRFSLSQVTGMDPRQPILCGVVQTNEEFQREMVDLRSNCGSAETLRRAEILLTNTYLSLVIFRCSDALTKCNNNSATAKIEDAV